MNKNTKIIGAIAIAVALIGGTAAIASYATRQSMDSQEVAEKKPARPHRHTQDMAAAQPVQQPVQQLPQCDDKNIVGTVAGGAVGGIAGSQIGKGSGKTAATIGGVVGGALLGNQYLPTRNVTCRQ